MATIVETRAVVTAIRIQVLAAGNRTVLEGVTQDAAGNTIRAFSEDVTAILTAPQKTNVDAVATRAQAWADSKL